MLNNINIKKLGLALGAILVATSLSVQGVFAYGPERKTFVGEKPADYVTFNSMTDNPKVGDERNFVRIKEVGQTGYVDSAKIVPGKEYEVYTFFHNNASSSLNTAEHGHKGIARNVKMLAKMPSIIRKGQNVDITSTISASNASPSAVWDHVAVSSPERDVALKYVPDSATVYSNGAINGKKLPSKIFSEGALLGYSDLNGIVPGCTEYSGYVTYRFKADFTDFSVNKTVSDHGKNNWSKTKKANLGEKVDYKIAYKNLGTTWQNNVQLKDVLPAGMKYVTGTTKLFNANNPNGKIINDDLFSKGINIGNYGVGTEAYIVFTAEVDSSKLACGVNNIQNVGQIHTLNGAKQDTATVTVQKDCSPKEREEPCPIPGKTHLKKGDLNCKEGGIEKCKIPGLEHLNANDKKCAQVPGELPQTGPAEAAAMVIAVMALTSGIAYYMRSRQELKTATESAGEIKSKITSKIEQIKSKFLKK